MTCTAGIFPFVDNWGHITGLISGLLLSLPLAMQKDGRGRYRCRQILCAFVGAGMWVVCAVMGLVLLYYYHEDADRFCPVCKYISCVPVPLWTCSYQREPLGNTTQRLLSAVPEGGSGGGLRGLSCVAPLPPPTL